MALVNKMRRQRAVWWEQTGTNHYGKDTYAEPVEIRCRWEDKQGTVTGENQEITNFKSEVYVDRIMKTGDVLKLGELDSSTPSDPSEEQQAYRVVGFSNIPDIRNRPGRNLMIAYL